MGKGALIGRNKSGHNVLALKKQGEKDLVALATLYYATQVAGQATATEEAKRRDIERFLAFYFELFHHYHPRDWHSAVTRSFLKSMREINGWRRRLCAGCMPACATSPAGRIRP